MPDESAGEPGQSDSAVSAAGAQLSTPVIADIPTPNAVSDATNPTTAVVWHHKHLRLEDQEAVSRPIADSDVTARNGADSSGHATSVAG